MAPLTNREAALGGRGRRGRKRREEAQITETTGSLASGIGKRRTHRRPRLGTCAGFPPFARLLPPPRRRRVGDAAWVTPWGSLRKSRCSWIKTRRPGRARRVGGTRGFAGEEIEAQNVSKMDLNQNINKASIWSTQCMEIFTT